MRLAKFVTITVGSLLFLFVWASGTSKQLIYVNVDPEPMSFIVVVAIIVLFTLAVRAIAKSRQSKRAYLILAQYTLCLAAVGATEDVFRGWYVWRKGDSKTITVGSLLFLYVLASWANNALIYIDIDPAPMSWCVVAAITVLFILAVWSIVRLRETKHAYLLLSQYTLCLAAVGAVQDTFRGWYV